MIDRNDNGKSYSPREYIYIYIHTRCLECFIQSRKMICERARKPKGKEGKGNEDRVDVYAHIIHACMYVSAITAVNKSNTPQKTLSAIIEAASSTESVQSNKIVRGITSQETAE